MLCIRSTEKLLGLKEVNHKNVKQLPDRTEIVITQVVSYSAKWNWLLECDVESALDRIFFRSFNIVCGKVYESCRTISCVGFNTILLIGCELPRSTVKVLGYEFISPSQ